MHILNFVTSKLASSKTILQFFVSSVGTITSGILGFIFYAIVARGMGPVDFGQFSIAVVTMVLISDIVNTGINTGIVSFVAESIRTNKEKALGFLKLAFIFKLVIALIALIFGWTSANFIANIIFAKPELAFILRLSFVGIVGMLFFSFATSALQSLQKFLQLTIVNIGSNTLRLASVVVLMLVGALNANNATISYIWVLFFFFFISLTLLPNFLSANLENIHKGKFIKYNLWIAILTTIGAITARADTFLLARISTLDEVGRYSVATSFVSIIPQLVTSLAVVVAPKLAALESSPKKAFAFFKKLLFVFGFIAFGITVMACLAAYLLIPLFYGVEYQSSSWPAILLILGQGFFIAATPIHISLIYLFKDVKAFCIVAILQLFIVLVLGVSFMPQQGAIGASIAIVVGHILNFLLPSILVYFKFKKI